MEWRSLGGGSWQVCQFQHRVCQLQPLAGPLGRRFEFWEHTARPSPAPPRGGRPWNSLRPEHEGMTQAPCSSIFLYKTGEGCLFGDREE